MNSNTLIPASNTLIPGRHIPSRHLLAWSRAIHVYLSIVLLLVLVFFALTGITLNHAAGLTGDPIVSTRALDNLPALPRDADGNIVASPALEHLLRSEFGVRLSLATLRQDGEFLIVDYQVPGAAALIEIDQAANVATMERTDYGVIALLNDLHKGRHVDVVWSALIDLSGALLVLFALAGFVLLLPNKRRFNQVLRYSLMGLLVTAAGYWLVLMVA
jgi:uncharacterized protein